MFKLTLFVSFLINMLMGVWWYFFLSDLVHLQHYNKNQTVNSRNAHEATVCIECIRVYYILS